MDIFALLHNDTRMIISHIKILFMHWYYFLAETEQTGKQKQRAFEDVVKW